MLRAAVLVVASLVAAPVAAQENVYLYVSYHQVDNRATVRHKLECVDSACVVSSKSAERLITLSPGQKEALLGALQAEAKRFVVAADSVPSDQLMKVKLRYDTPRKRLEIERRLPADKPADLTPQMLQVIRTYLDLDLSQPLVPKPVEGDKKSPEPGAQDAPK